MYRRNRQFGFTLIETLVAISILTMAIAAPLSLASQSLFAAYYARDQMVATQLAQEGVEIIRQKRDSQILKAFQEQEVTRDAWLADIPIGDTVGAKASVAVDIADLQNVRSCGSLEDDRCAPLYFVGGVYRSVAFLSSADVSAADPSRFRRIVELERISDNELRVRSVVQWQTGSFTPRTISAEEVLYNWVPENL